MKRSALDHTMRMVAPMTLIAAVSLLVLYFANSGNKTAKQNNAYIRVINCIISKNVATRQQNDIEDCYSVVEHDLDTKLQRYDGRRR